MKKNLFSFCAFILLSVMANAQSCDPWIIKAYQQLYGRGPSAEECNIRNYNNGSWNNYNELVSYIKSFKSKKSNTSSAAVQGDPWIFQAYRELYNRTPSAWEVNIQNYNGGSWSNYNELKKYVQDFQNSLRKLNMDIKTVDAGNGKAIAFLTENGQAKAVALVNLNGGQVVAAGGANVVSAGGANVVSAGGANLQNLAAMNFGSRYTVQAAGSRVVPTSGKGAIIVK